MKFVLLCIGILVISGCTTGFDPNFRAMLLSDSNELDADQRPPKNELNHLVEKLVVEMLSNNQFVTKQNAIAVTSIVDLKSLDKTNRLSHQLSEGLVHYLHDSGYRVVDFKLTGAIAVTGEGDFIHSRDLDDLKVQQAVDYLVSGTLDRYDSGIYLSVRMVGAQSQVIVGSAQTFISQALMRRFTEQPHLLADSVQGRQRVAQEEKANADFNSRKASMKNGFIVRKQY